MEAKLKLSEEKLKQIADEKARRKAQLEAKRAKEYNIGFTIDQRAIQNNKVKVLKKAREEANRKALEKIRKREERKARRLERQMEKKKVEEERIITARLTARRFYNEIADKVVLISKRLSSSKSNRG